jgi:hypothetical protein
MAAPVVRDLKGIGRLQIIQLINDIQQVPGIHGVGSLFSRSRDRDVNGSAIEGTFWFGGNCPQIPIIDLTGGNLPQIPLLYGIVQNEAER